MHVTDSTKMDDPHDDCTHWAGQIPNKDTDSPKRVDKRGDRGQSESDILSEELGVEKKR